jgi:hypothetical protein
MRNAREHILANDFEDWKSDFLDRYKYNSEQKEI